MAVNGCPVCLHKQRRIDELEEEVKSLRAKLRLQERREKDGPFGSSTPSAKLPLKPNTEEKEKKPRGARAGHKGAGRKSHDDQTADRTVDVASGRETCPDCGTLLEKKGWAERSVIDTPRQKPGRVILGTPYLFRWQVGFDAGLRERRARSRVLSRLPVHAHGRQRACTLAHRQHFLTPESYTKFEDSKRKSKS
jgi:hypothetical protein